MCSAIRCLVQYTIRNSNGLRKGILWRLISGLALFCNLRRSTPRAGTFSCGSEAAGSVETGFTSSATLASTLMNAGIMTINNATHRVTRRKDPRQLTMSSPSLNFFDSTVLRQRWRTTAETAAVRWVCLNCVNHVVWIIRARALSLINSSAVWPQFDRTLAL